MSKGKKVTAVGVIVVIMIAAIAFVLVDRYKDKIEEGSNKEYDFYTESYQEKEYKGKKYEYNTDIQTIAFLGVDTREKAEEGSMPGWNGQSDTILVAVIDTATEKAKILQIPRDTMTIIELYDIHGEYYISEKAQLAFQYAYGDGGVTSCVLVTDRISELLGEIPITYYLSLNMDGIPALSEAMGGIDIVIEEDMTYIDPEYTKGKKVTLKGEDAEHFVRYRDTNETGSNAPRMKRQDQVIQAIMHQLPEKAKDDSDMYGKLFKQADKYMTTNLKLDNIEALEKYDFDEEIINVPGTLQEGEYHDEFYIDEEQFMGIIIDLFYKEK